jgi:hypothetical protein
MIMTSLKWGTSVTHIRHSPGALSEGGAEVESSRQRDPGAGRCMYSNIPARPAVHRKAHNLLCSVRARRVEHQGFQRSIRRTNRALRRMTPKLCCDCALRGIVDERSAFAKPRRNVAGHVYGLSVKIKNTSEDSVTRK